MSESIRKRSENNEHMMFSDYACFSDRSRGRAVPEKDDDIRTCFQRDRDRIIHCKAFRRLKHKTQVFLAPESDHYRTRLTHTLEVAQIARTISRALRLNEDLTEAVALGHDLGHTPFGHAGERALDKLLSGGFTHYEQSVRVCERIEKNGKGLNLTLEVLDGILTHTKGPEAVTLEGRIVRISDRIAYINHDIDDAVRGGIISEDDIPYSLKKHLGFSKSQRIDTMVKSVVENSTDTIRMDSLTYECFESLREFLFDKVYINSKAKTEESKVFGLVKGLYDYYVASEELLPEEYRKICESEGVERAVADYIAGMTDHFAAKAYSDIYIPGFWKL